MCRCGKSGFEYNNSIASIRDTVMSHISSFFRAVSVAVFTISSCTAWSETLEEIYQQALTNDHQYQAARAAYEAGLEEKSIGRAGLLPSLSGSGTWVDVDFESEG